MPRANLVKHQLLLIAVQVACVGMAMCIHYLLLVSTVRQAAETQAWDDLEVEKGRWTGVARKLSVAGAGSAEEQQAALAGMAGSRPPLPGFQLTLVDAHWHVRPGAQPVRGRGTAAAVGDGPLAWTKSPSRLARGSEWLSGFLDMPDGQHVAVAYPLQHSSGYLLLHRPVRFTPVSIAAVERMLPAVVAVTFVWISVVLAITLYMMIRRFYDGLAQQRSEAEAKALRNLQSLERTRDAVIFGLAKLAESRHLETGHHLDRIAKYAVTLAAALRWHPKLGPQVTPEFVKLIEISSVLHDIGKVGLKDTILLKPGRLTSEERTQMEEHTKVGAGCLLEIERRLGSSNFLEMARCIARSHHERWDGSGYPDGLAGEQIPLAARIVGIADVYDALSSKRVYKEALPHRKCVELIVAESGKQFDPDLVDAFLGVEGQYFDIASRYSLDLIAGDQLGSSSAADPTEPAVRTARHAESEPNERSLPSLPLLALPETTPSTHSITGAP